MVKGRVHVVKEPGGHGADDCYALATKTGNETRQEDGSYKEEKGKYRDGELTDLTTQIIRSAGLFLPSSYESN